MRIVLFIVIVLTGNFVFSQDSDTSVAKHLDLPAVRYDQYFDLHYRQKLNQIRRTYPLALRAKEILDELEEDLENADSKRKKRKLTKERKNELKDEFTYLVKDLYIGEGAMLFKLIHRETGASVTEILEEYRGSFYAKSVQATFSLYGHDTDSKFDAQGEDWISELVIRDIESGKIQIDLNVVKMSKEEFKDNMKDYRQNYREHKKNVRKAKRDD